MAVGDYAGMLFLAAEAEDGHTLRELVEAQRSQSKTIGLSYARTLLGHVTHGLETGSHTIAVLVIFALVAFVAYRIVQYLRFRMHGLVPKVGVEEIALRLASEGAKEIILADVRSHGYYDPGTQRIAGSIRIEPSQLANELKNIPHDKDIYLYCT